MFKSRQLAAIALTALAVMLTGCGRTGSPVVPVAPKTTRQVVGLPNNYQVGQPMPGQEGTPSLREINWPRITHTAKGVSSDPVNLIISGTERQVRHVFGATGWVEADKVGLISSLRTIKGAIADTSYPTSPMSDLYLYNRKQDIALQKNADSVRARDHLRVWKTPLLDHKGRPFWAIAATKDVAIKWAPDELLPTHQISPDLDAERQVVVNDFLKSGQVALRYQLQSLAPNFRGVNGGGDEMFSDGKVEVLELKIIN